MARLFQSTQPSQAVTIDRVDALKDSYEFQSTQPSQAVTKEIETLSAYIKISIHTALAGCDGCAFPYEPVEIDFNPHSPRRL